MKKIFGLSILTFILFAFIPPRKGYQIGDTVGAFSLKNVDGQNISLASFKDNKGLIVVFDCNTCPVSRAYNSRLIALGKKYERTFPLILINANDPQQSPDDSFEAMIAYSKSKGYSFPYLSDETQEVAKSFGATNTPHAFVLKKNGSAYVVAYIGAIDDNTRNSSDVKKRYVEDAVDALLNGKSVPVEKTKAVGCGIRWK